MIAKNSQEVGVNPANNNELAVIQVRIKSVFSSRFDTEVEVMLDFTGVEEHTGNQTEIRREYIECGFALAAHLGNEQVLFQDHLQFFIFHKRIVIHADDQTILVFGKYDEPLRIK